MGAPKEIHRFLLKEGFRHVGRGGYWKFMKNKPIAWLVRVHDIEIRDEKFIYIFLNLAYPDDGMLNDVDAFCADGLLRPQTGDACDTDLYCYPFEKPELALKLLQETMWKWFDVISNPEIMLDLTDFFLGKRSVPPEEFDYIPDHLKKKNISIGECASTLYDKVRYLLLAGKYEEAKSILLDSEILNGNFKKWNPDSYQLALDSAVRKRIIVPEDFMNWIEKKKLALDREWQAS